MEIEVLCLLCRLTKTLNKNDLKGIEKYNKRYVELSERNLTVILTKINEIIKVINEKRKKPEYGNTWKEEAEYWEGRYNDLH